MMKILFISHCASRTGAPIVLYSFLSWLKKEREDISFELLLLGGGELEKDFRNLCAVHYGWNIYSKTEKRMHRYLRYTLDPNKWKRFINDKKYDLLYANTIVSLPVGVELKNEFGIPLLLHLHESEVGYACMGYDDNLLHNCDSFIAVSQPVKDVLQRRGVPATKIHVIHPVSSTMLRNINYCKTYEEKESYTIGLVGYYGWTKGSDLLPLVANRLRCKFPDVKCKFDWVGNFKLLNHLELNYDLDLLGVKDMVEILPKSEDPTEYYKKFDVFLLLSREDSFPLVALENAAMGTPVVLFNHSSGLLDYFNNDISALVVPYLDIDSLADSLYRLCSDTPLRERIGIRGKSVVKKIVEEERPFQIICTCLSSFSN